MTRYVALIRGIGPANPNMSNEKLRGVLEGLGLHNVRSVISSGNVLFDSNDMDTTKLEKEISESLNSQLGIPGNTIVRSREQLQELIDRDPFMSTDHNAKTYLTVTFLKSDQKLPFEVPHQPDGKAYQVIAAYDRVICSVVDLTAAKTPDLMSWLERQLGKDITTRTWKSIGRILNKMTD